MTCYFFLIIEHLYAIAIIITKTNEKEYVCFCICFWAYFGVCVCFCVCFRLFEARVVLVCAGSLHGDVKICVCFFVCFWGAFWRSAVTSSLFVDVSCLAFDATRIFVVVPVAYCSDTCYILFRYCQYCSVTIQCRPDAAVSEPAHTVKAGIKATNECASQGNK